MSTDDEFERDDTLEVLILKYSAKGNLDEAVSNAEQKLFDAIRVTNDGVPLEVMVSALDVWMEWVSRTLAATLMALAASQHGWSPKEQFQNTESLMATFQLLKHDAFYNVFIEAKGP